MHRGVLQVCAGQEVGSETDLHAIWDVYPQGEIEAVLPLENASNFLIRKTKLHKVSITLPIITFIWKCYI